MAFSATWCPAGTSLETLVAIEGHCSAIEDSFGDGEERTWSRSQRDAVIARRASPRILVMLAYAMMATIRHHANAPRP